jgi:hypothetical protein
MVMLTGDGLDGVQVSGHTLAEDEGGRGVVSGRVSDGVALASNDTLGREVVDLDGLGSDSSDEGRAGNDGLEEAHVD